MGVKVISINPVTGVKEHHEYPHASEWYASSEDASLQVYQRTEEDPERIIAEYPRGNWHRAQISPLPGPQQDNEKEGASE